VVWHQIVGAGSDDDIFFVRAGCCADADGDGFGACDGDCDDRDATRWPGHAELCDGLDNDCDGALPPDELDPDLDGVPACAGDCAVDDPAVYSGAPELNDGIDNQCAGDRGYGAVDELSGSSGFTDPSNRDRYAWPRQLGASRYEVLRSTSPDLSTGCVTWSTPETSWIDPSTPDPDQVFHYLGRPLEPYPGSWGRTSAGVERSCPSTMGR
jgi:hypothetical protein